MTFGSRLALWLLLCACILGFGAAAVHGVFSHALTAPEQWNIERVKAP